MLADDTLKAIETFAHVAGLDGEVDLEGDLPRPFFLSRSLERTSSPRLNDSAKGDFDRMFEQSGFTDAKLRIRFAGDAEAPPAPPV